VKAVVDDACSQARNRHPEVCEAVENFATEFLTSVTARTEHSQRAADIATLQMQMLEKTTNWSEDVAVVSLLKRLSKETPVLATAKHDTPTPLELAEDIVFDTDNILRTVRQIQVFDTAASKYLTKVTSQMHTEEAGPLQLQNH